MVYPGFLFGSYSDPYPLSHFALTGEVHTQLIAARTQGKLSVGTNLQLFPLSRQVQ
jgi:hypothetical protein